MKKFFFLLLAVCTLSGCSSLRQVPVQLVSQVQKDTIFQNRIQYDSIYIDQWQYRDRSADTIYLEKVRLEYKYKFLKDTVRIIQIDSIPVIREVEVVKTERFVPSIYKWSLAICITLIVLLILYVLWKIKF